MRGIIYVFPLIWTITRQSEPFDLLSSADKFFGELQTFDKVAIDDIKSMVKRSHQLNGARRIFKRSADHDELFQREKGVFVLNDIKDVAVIPAKFPNDINILLSRNSLLVTALESNGTNPEIRLANDMVLYQYSPMHGINEIGRVPVFGGIVTGIHSFRNTAYLITAEHEANKSSDSFEGSTLYKIVEHHDRISLEKIQILNVIEPNFVVFWEHQDEFYLAIGSNTGNDTLRTGTLIYRWMGRHFDCIQHISSKSVKSVVPFTIGSFMYLAIANYQDEHGNTDILSKIYQFRLEDLKFHLYQNIETHGALNMAHFKFVDEKSKKSEHFLAVANYIGKNSNGALTSFLESVIYKFNGNRFIPFQSFKLLGATQWLPIQGAKGEFLLLVSHSNGVRGYQYDGWRFSQVSLKFSQSALGENIQTMRTFSYYGDIFLTIADKSSFGEDINLWKLSFKYENDLEEKYSEVKIWCETMTSNLYNDNITKTLENLRKDAQVFPENKKVKVEDLTLTEPQKEAIDEIKGLMAEAEEMTQVLNEAENAVDGRKIDYEIPIVIGSKMIPHLEIRCQTRECVSFKNLQVSKVNGEDMMEFFKNVVSVEDNSVSESGIVFEEISVEKELSSASINGHPAATLVDVWSETFLNSELIVNGTVFINNDFNIDGTFDGLAPDENHLLLYDRNQMIDDKLILNTLKVKNFKLIGNINKHSIQDLVHPKMSIKNTYEKLNVNNLIIDGSINGYPMETLMENAVVKSDREIQGDLKIENLEADEILVDSEDIYGNPISKFTLLNPCSNESEKKVWSKVRSNEFSEQEENDDIIIVVEGTLKATDVSDETDSMSLLDILHNSYHLDETLIFSSLKIQNVSAEHVEADVINGTMVDSWILKDSLDVREIYGKKTFLNNIHVDKEAFVKRINGINLETFPRKFIDSQENELVFGDWIFDAITCDEITTNFTNIGNASLSKLNRLIVKNSFELDSLRAESLTVNGKLDNISWHDFLGDSIFDSNDFVESVKTIKGNVEVDNLNLNGRINGLVLDELMDVTSKKEHTVVLDKDVVLEETLNVEDLNFEGSIDSILNSRFHEEWMLKAGAQIIPVSVTFENIKLNSGSVLTNETVNNVNLKKLFSRSLKIHEDTKIKHLYALDKIKVGELGVRGTVNGADFRSSIVRSKGGKRQDMSGGWLFENDLNINGTFFIEGFVSGLNISKLCQKKESEKINLVVGGGLTFEKEPNIVKVNGFNIEDTRKKIWMKNENTTLNGSQMKLEDVHLHRESNLFGHLNDLNLTHLSRHYLSKTMSRVASADLDLKDMIIERWCRMRKASVNGTVNGINLDVWAKNVLLLEEDQILEGKPKFNIFEASEVALEGTVNRLNLLNDVLRYDVENAVVEGEKTFESLRVLNLTTGNGGKIQGVDVDAWKNDLFTPNGNFSFRENLILKDAEFRTSIKVLGNVKGVLFDDEHLLKRNKNQVVKGSKHFRSDSTMRIKNLKVSGLVNGLDLNFLMRMQAYSDRDLVFTESQTFTKGLNVDAIQVEGSLQGVNVSEMCHDISNPVNAEELRKGFVDLTLRTNALIEIARGRAFFFDYLESVQTFKPNVKAVVPTVDARGYYLSVLTPNLMRFMNWNEYSESFVNAGESLTLKDNITFVTSVASTENSFLYIESTNSAKIFMSDRLQEIDGVDTSCVAAFELKPLNKSCIFVGNKYNSSRILCSSLVTGDLRTYQWLESKGSVQVTVLTVKDEVYLAVINKEEIVDKFENSLTIYRFDPKLQHFHESHTLAEVNPVAVSSITYKGNHYLVSAGGHLPESVHNSIISIFRYNKNHKVFVRSKSIQVDTPVDVQFALLPSSELALYVLTSNPTKPLVVYLHRGIAGFVEETSGLSLYPGSNLYSFTDSENRHFVVISGFGRGQILKAGFKGGPHA